MNIEEKRKEIEKFFKKYETDNLEIKSDISGDDTVMVYFNFYATDLETEKAIFNNIVEDYKKVDTESLITPNISDIRLNVTNREDFDKPTKNKAYFCMITVKQ